MIRLAFVLVLLVHAATLAQGPQSVQGIVVDQATNAPVRGARVQISGEPSVLSDSDGRFSLVWPPEGSVLNVTKPGFARIMARTGSAGGVRMVVPLRRAGSLLVAVFDEFNEPKRGSVLVQALPNTQSISAALSSLDDRGEMRVPNLAPGSYQVTLRDVYGQLLRLPARIPPDEVVRFRNEIVELLASQPQDQPATRLIVDVKADEETTLYLVDAAPLPDRPVIDLTKGVATLVEDGHVSGPGGTSVVQGRVTQPDGRPVAGARVTVNGRALASVASDHDGRYTLAGLPGGTFRVAAGKKGFVAVAVGSMPAGDGPTTVTLQDDEQRVLNVTLRPASTVVGLVVDEHGEPVYQARVLLLRVPADTASREPPATAASAATDERGRYAFRGVPPGEFYLFTSGETQHQGEVHLFHPGYLSVTGAQSVRVDEGLDLDGPTLRLNRALGTRVQGTALDAGGAPVRGRVVQITGTETTGFRVIPRISRILRSGGFEFLNVSPGEYEISLQDTPPLPSVPALLGLTPTPAPATPGTARVVVRVQDSPPPPVTLRVVP